MLTPQGAHSCTSLRSRPRSSMSSYTLRSCEPTRTLQISRREAAKSAYCLANRPCWCSLGTSWATARAACRYLSTWRTSPQAQARCRVCASANFNRRANMRMTVNCSRRDRKVSMNVPAAVSWSMQAISPLPAVCDSTTARAALTPSAWLAPPPPGEAASQRQRTRQEGAAGWAEDRACSRIRSTICSCLEATEQLICVFSRLAASCTSVTTSARHSLGTQDTIWAARSNRASHLLRPSPSKLQRVSTECGISAGNVALIQA
mmetsp:Transcript_23556/g.50909  ORF Transcript_23556/g.50909 Transcript_23556/m.50909 type:complete len:262 (+) Transcript_23556:1370-2155(+)